MTRTEFLEAVLPPNGRYAVVGIDKKEIPDHAKKSIRNWYANSIAEASALADRLVTDNFNVYYGTATYGAGTTRIAGDVTAKQELYIDVDCGEGKPYPDKYTGLAALKDFIAATKLPKPLIVDSGNGLQAHWPFTASVDRSEWHRVALSLKALCLSHGLFADEVCTADAARILRMPYTYNYNGVGGDVTIMVIGKPTPFEKLKGIIGEIEVPDTDIFAKARALNPKRELDEITKALMGNRESLFQTIWIKSQEGTGCAQIKNAIDKATTLSEPTWRAALSIASACSDRDWAIHEISKDHPDYDPDATEKKAQGTNGPYRCESFSKLDTGSLCKECPHLGKITSPIQIGLKIVRAPENAVIEQPTEVGVKKYDLPKLPWPYFHGKNGGIYKENTLPPKEGEEAEEIKEILVYPNTLYIYKRMVDPDLGDVVWVRLHLPKDGTREFTLSQGALMSRDKFRDAISVKGVIAFTIPQIDALQQFFVAMVKQLQFLEKALPMHGRFGWTPTNSFIVGDREYTKTGVFHTPPANNLGKLVEQLEPIGDVEKWRQMVNFYGRDNMEPLALALFAGFGAPLVKMSGERGSMLNLYSNESGTGKTTALKVVNSIYGHPEKLLLNSEDTYLSKVHRIGTMSSLPVTIDEITNMTAENTSDFAYMMSAGRGKHRMMGKANEERANNTEFYNITITSSNSSLIDKLRTLKDDPQGEMARILEIRVESSLELDVDEVAAVFDERHKNHGIAGHIYLQHLITNPDSAAIFHEEAKKMCARMFDFKGPERFHANTIICATAGGLMSKALNLHDINVMKVLEWLKNQYRQVRAATVMNKSDSETTISSYVNENRVNMLIIDGAMRKNGVPTAPHMEAKNKLEIRYEPDTDTLFIAQPAFVRWCAKSQVNTKELADGLLKNYNVEMILTKKRLAKGTSTDLGSVRVYELKHLKERLGFAPTPDEK